jgi:DNA-binding response OmpR family regulator
VDERSILVIEDDDDIANLVTLHLGDAGFSTSRVANGREGLELVLGTDVDLLILDLMLPGVDGLEICRQVRSSERYTPILMLTARSDEVDRVLGLELGADDYLTKPFSVRELVARVKALFRRVDACTVEDPPEDTLLDFGDLKIDPQRREVEVGGVPVELTAKEFDLLAHFARHPGRVFSRAMLLQQVWDYAFDGYEHTVNTHINRLRQKIEPEPSSPRWVTTVWGVGYKFSGDRDRARSA